MSWGLDNHEEQRRQALHEQRQDNDPQHDQYGGCWCCCIDCDNTGWNHDEEST